MGADDPPSCKPSEPVDRMSRQDGFVRLVRLAVHTLYTDVQIGATGDTVDDVLDLLTRHHWIQEKNLAKELNMDRKKLKPILHFLQQENFIQREVLQKSKRQKTTCTTNVANSERQYLTMERKEGIKIQTKSNSYCCLDYAKVYDVVKNQIRKMTQNLKTKLTIEDVVQQYRCTDCEISYSALDANQLTSSIGHYFHCEKCNKKLVENDYGEIHNQSLEMLQKIEEELRPLSSLLHELEGAAVPKFVSLQEWRQRIIHENVDAIMPVPLVEATSIEPCIAPIAGHGRLKDLATWIIKGEGSSITEEQLEFLSSKLNSNRQVGVKSKRDHSI